MPGLTTEEQNALTKKLADPKTGKDIPGVALSSEQQQRNANQFGKDTDIEAAADENNQIDGIDELDPDKEKDNKFNPSPG